MPSRRDTGESPASTSAGPMLRGLVLPVFLPVIATEVGNGAVAPVIATTTTGFGGSTAVAALMVALLGIGRVVGDIPASVLAERLGDRRSMLVAATVSVLAYGGCLLSGSLVVYGIGLLVAGVANAVFYLARQSLVIETVEQGLRARALSTLGGAHRVGLFLGGRCRRWAGRTASGCSSDR
jgi:MFS family permease